jgi:hypothetical protein
MKGTRVIGLHREVKKAGNPKADRAILRATGKELRAMGASVSFFHPEKLKSDRKVDIIFGMARTERVHKILRAYEARGVKVINSPQAISESLNRKVTYEKMRRAGIPIPETKVVSISSIKPEGMKGKFIFKRPDRHEFTRVVSSPKEVKDALAFYKKQCLKEVVIQKFVEGKHVKFYGIGQEIFLPAEIEGGNKAMVGKIKNYAMRSGQVSGLKVFGGDMIVSGKKAFVVDLNDWPSFSYIKEQAAKGIAELIRKEHRGK